VRMNGLGKQRQQAMCGERMCKHSPTTKRTHNPHTLSQGKPSGKLKIDFKGIYEMLPRVKIKGKLSKILSK